MKRNVSVVKLCLYVSECVCSKIIKELPGLVGSGTPYTNINGNVACLLTKQEKLMFISFSLVLKINDSFYLFVFNL